jgi:uncharacterized protein
MNLPEYNNYLKDEFLKRKSSCPDGTPYKNLGDEILEMIRSYISDAGYFERTEDLVNQFASLSYAHGWLSAGIYLGIINGSDRFFSYTGFLYPAYERYDAGHLTEKMQRYNRMLKKALESVNLAPASGSPMIKAAGFCISQAEHNLNQGQMLEKKRLEFPALGFFSYGYGWLDCAIRSGLIKILSDPGLFTTEL